MRTLTISLAIACSMASLHSASAAIVADFESPAYALGDIGGQQGWVEFNNNALDDGFVVASSSSGQYQGGQALTSSPGVHVRKLVSPYNATTNSITADFYWGTSSSNTIGDINVYAWYDANSNGAADSGESIFGFGISDPNTSAVPRFWFRSLIAPGAAETFGNPIVADTWYRITATINYLGGTATVTAFDLTNNQSVDVGANLANIAVSYGGIDPTTYNGTVVNLSGGSNKLLMLDNIGGIASEEIPEPSSIILGAMGLLGLVFAVRRKKRARG